MSDRSGRQRCPGEGEEWRRERIKRGRGVEEGRSFHTSHLSCGPALALLLTFKPSSSSFRFALPSAPGCTARPLRRPRSTTNASRPPRPTRASCGSSSWRSRSRWGTCSRPGASRRGPSTPSATGEAENWGGRGWIAGCPHASREEKILYQPSGHSSLPLPSPAASLCHPYFFPSPIHSLHSPSTFQGRAGKVQRLGGLPQPRERLRAAHPRGSCDEAVPAGPAVLQPEEALHGNAR